MTVNNMEKLPELLAPAGNIESLKAAINGGTDAVYFGVPQFNARMKAKNFSPTELDEAFSLCALHGVKTNVTLNTLLYGREFGKAFEVVAELEKSYKPDAYIIQDLGLAAELKRRFPGIVLHASTQAEVHNAYGLEPFKRLGFSRVVIAREVSFNEIAAFKGCGLETEIFIHGAICVCQSGGCLMSSLIGGRSGNRGECAYPCRLPYKGRSAYPLSLKDMCLASHIPEIIDLGVTALKIEGRMKPPEYVYEVTSLYRRLLDERRSATEEEIRRQQAVFSRSGFTDGYFTGKISPSMFGIRSDEDKQKSRSVETVIEQRKIPLDITATVSKDLAAAKFTCRGLSVAVECGDVSEAKTMPLAAADMENRLGKLGNTPFSPRLIKAEVAAGLYMTVSAQNELRRKGVEAITSAIIGSRRRENAPELMLPPMAERKTAPGLVIRMGKKPNINHLDAAVRYELPLEQPRLWKPLIEAYKDKLCLVVPRTVYDTQLDEIKELIDEAKRSGITSLCIENAEFLPLAEGFTVYGGLCLNVTNKHTYEVLNSLGFAQVTVSPEANMALAAETDSAYTVYGRLPLMHTRACIISNICGCKKEGDSHSCRTALTDRTGAAFEVCGGFGHTNTIYNSVPLWLLDKKITSPNPVLYFVSETEAEENAILKAYYDKKPPNMPFTRGVM